jgi:carboxyl-terminal processing protease
MADDEQNGEEDESADTLKVEDREVFYTNGGRIVYGGGGIVPDVDVDRETWKPIEINLERQQMFFDYAVKYVADHPDLDINTFEVTDPILKDFKAFTEEKDFSYKSALQVSLEDLENTINEEDKNDVFKEQLDEMHALIDQEKHRDFENSSDYIKRAIKREIISSIAGETGVYEHIVLVKDTVVQQAVSILQNDGEYTKLITEGQKKAEL